MAPRGTADCPDGRWRLTVLTAYSLAVGIAHAASPGYVIDTYDPALACNGTTLLTDNHDTNAPKVIQVDMQGDIVWQYVIPTNYAKGIGPGFDAEMLTSGHVLIVMARKGMIEVNRQGQIVWSNTVDTRLSHDADRLPNGDTIYVFGDNDMSTDAVVKVVNSNNALQWSWYATNEYQVWPYCPFTNVAREGWTHANAVTRMDNSNTLISLRNFNMTIEVNPEGQTVWAMDYTNIYAGDSLPEDLGYDPHEPELVPGDRLLVCLQRSAPVQVLEVERYTSNIWWSYHRDGLRTARDSDRLANGNTLIVGVLTQMENSVVFEVTTSSQIVWQFRLTNASTSLKPGWFYKAQRIADFDQDGDPDSLDPDDDNDGMSDADELVAGTSATNAGEYFRVEEIARAATAGETVISWQTVTDRTYKVYRWTNIAERWPTQHVYESSGDDTLQAYTNPAAPPGRVFWRLSVEP